MERFIKLRGLQERRADRSLNEICKFQRDCFAALDVQGEIYAYDKEVTFSKVLPISDPSLATTEEVKLIVKTKPTPSSPTKTSFVSV